ncbi:hypothetical protein C7E23_08370 [Elizabethkingia anophelis]|nr:hypothetical protein C7E23_08370 [Elizabethkingia anophelis]
MTTTSWHLKIRTIFPMELDIDKNPGYVIPVMIGYDIQGIPVLRRFMLWSYDAMRNIADITIHPSPDKELYNWLGDLQNGKIIKWMNPEEMVLQESNADCYYLIGNADAQSFFLSVQQESSFFPVWSTVFIYSRHTGEFFSGCGRKLSIQLSYYISL